jgi:hypothetical protein
LFEFQESQLKLKESLGDFVCPKSISIGLLLAICSF